MSRAIERAVRPWDLPRLADRGGKTAPGSRLPAPGPDGPAGSRELGAGSHPSAGSWEPEAASREPRVASLPTAAGAAVGLLESAREQAEELLRQARAEADEIRAAASREGFADGQARGMEEARAAQEHAGRLAAQLGAAYRD